MSPSTTAFALLRRGLRAFAVPIAFVTILGLYAPTVEGASNKYYVAPSGNDGNPGSLDQPWRTINKANQELGPGDTVLIREGEYDEIIEPYRSGEPGRPITYTNHQDEQVVIRGKPGQAHLVAIGFSIDGPSGSDSYIVVDGLTFSYGHDIGDKRFGWLVIRGSRSRHNEIKNCTIFRAGDPLENDKAGWDEFGIILNATRNTLVENNELSGMKIGIKITNAARYNRIRNNHIHDTYQSSISIGSSGSVIQGNLIEGNVLERSAIEDGIQFLQDDKAPDRSTDISNFGTIIRSNIIRNNAENAIDLKGAAHVVIEGNILYGSIGSSDGPLKGWNRNAHATITRGSRTATRDVIIRNNVLYDNSNGIRLHDGYMVYNNTLVANNRDFTGSNSDWRTNDRPAFWGIRHVDSKADRFVIKNNIVAGHNVVELALRLGRDPHADIDYNLYRNNSFADFRTSGDWIVYSFAEWRDALSNTSNISGNDSHSILTSAPLFLNAPSKPMGNHSNHNFGLSADSPAVDAGGPLTRTVGSGSGTQIQLTDARYFYNGFGITEGDRIQIGSAIVRITDVDYGEMTIKIDRSISWSDGDWVNLPYSGSAPDIGAVESGFVATAVPMDLNMDGRIDVLDVQLGVNVFLGTGNNPGIRDRADVNGDGTVNVLDVQLIVNFFLLG